MRLLEVTVLNVFFFFFNSGNLALGIVVFNRLPVFLGWNFSGLFSFSFLFVIIENYFKKGFAFRTMMFFSGMGL
jgi:hypothetical protein